MRPIQDSWQRFFLAFSGWVNAQKEQTIEFRNAQNQALMDKMGRTHILLNDNQRRILAFKDKAIDRKSMMELTTVVTSDTLMRWHRRQHPQELRHRTGTGPKAGNDLENLAQGPPLRFADR